MLAGGIGLLLLLCLSPFVTILKAENLQCLFGMSRQEGKTVEGQLLHDIQTIIALPQRLG